MILTWQEKMYYKILLWWLCLIVLCNEEQSSFVEESVETFQNTLELNWVKLTRSFHWNSTASDATTQTVIDVNCFVFPLHNSNYISSNGLVLSIIR